MSNTLQDPSLNAEQFNELSRLRSAVAGTMTAIMMINRDLTVTYVNKATEELLQKHEEALRTLCPEFVATKIIGVNIDVFHKDPAHQRKLLSDPANLPYSTDIQVGPLTFNINVTSQIDVNGEYIGNTLEWYDVTEQRVVDAQNVDYQGQIEAIGRSQAVIEFNMDGSILTANDNFLSTMGYTLEEVQGKHHSMFAEPEYANSAEYKQFWAKLNQGQFETAEYKRIGKNGKEIWIQASYNPIQDLNGKPFKVVKYATDVTAEKLQNADFQGQISAIGKSQAVIEFNMDGSIITANDNFLRR